MEEKIREIQRPKLPPWLYLPTDGYDATLVSAQDRVSRMSAQERMGAMDRITEAFRKSGVKS